MSQNRIDGAAKQAAGTIKEAAGKVVGNERLQAEGAAEKAIGTAQAMWAGNARRDTDLKYTGSNNDRDPILSAIGGSVPTSTTTGYLLSDVNMDGTVKYVGSENDRDPILSNVGGTVPTSVLGEQLP